jgi:hypothetical protein
MRIVPAQSEIWVGQTLSVAIEVVAGTQQVDGAAVYLDFAPDVFQVVSITPGTKLSTVLQSTYDNTLGQVDMAAGLLQGSVSGTFLLGTIELKGIGSLNPTLLHLNTTGVRRSEVSFSGTSVLHKTEDVSVSVIPGGVLNGRVVLEGRPTAPHERWVTPLDVQFFVPNEVAPKYTFATTTDTKGGFQVVDIPPGEYIVSVENHHTLRRMEMVTIGVDTTGFDFGLLPEGDAINDDVVDLLDFSQLASSFDLCRGMNEYANGADFDEDGCISISDFSLLSKNFSLMGDSLVAGSGTHDFAVITDKDKGERFAITVAVSNPYSQPLDASALHLLFEPDDLQVIKIDPGAELDTVIENQWDNPKGTIDYVAGTLEIPVSSSLTLATIHLEAKRTIVQSEISYRIGGGAKTGIAHGGRLLLWDAVYDTGGVVMLQMSITHGLYLPQIQSD